MSHELRKLFTDDSGWIIIPIWWSRKAESSSSSGGGGGCCGIIVLFIAGAIIWSLAQGMWRWLTSAWWRIPAIIIGVFFVLAMTGGATSWSDDDDRE